MPRHSRRTAKIQRLKQRRQAWPLVALANKTRGLETFGEARRCTIKVGERNTVLYRRFAGVARQCLSCPLFAKEFDDAEHALGAISDLGHSIHEEADDLAVGRVLSELDRIVISRMIQISPLQVIRVAPDAAQSGATCRARIVPCGDVAGVAADDSHATNRR